MVTFAAGTLSTGFNVCDGTLSVAIVPADRYVDGQSLISAATINFFNLLFFALALLYAVRELHLRAGLVG